MNKKLAEDFDNRLIVKVIYQAKMPNIVSFKLLQTEDLLLFSVLY